MDEKTKRMYCVLISTGDQTRGFYHLVDDEQQAKIMAAETGGFQPFPIDVII